MMNHQSPNINELSGTQFHHIGYATKSINDERIFFNTLGYIQEGEDFSDPQQGIFGCFLTGPGPRIELLQNLKDSKTLTPWIHLGIKMYHLAYTTENLTKAINWGKLNKGKMISKPITSIAFNGANICFFMFRNGLMIEFIEIPNPKGSND
jgi:methylmalonyl-CoA/ethylmalonyl-CoA epimerase